MSLLTTTLTPQRAAVPKTGHIIVIGGQKGGIGKTTIALNLAVMCRLAGKSVLLIDSDHQQSLASVISMRHLNKIIPEIPVAGLTAPNESSGPEKQSKAGPSVAVAQKLKTLSARYDVVIVDTTGVDSDARMNIELRGALLVAHTLITPTRTGNLDTWTLKHVSKLVQTANGTRQEAAQMVDREPPLPINCFIHLNFTHKRELDEINGTRKYLSEAYPEFAITEKPFKSMKIWSTSAPDGKAVIETLRIDSDTRTALYSFYREIIQEDWTRQYQEVPA